MTPDELIDVVGQAYGEPTDDIAEALFDLVHKTWDQTDTSEEQARALRVALERVRYRLTRVINAVAAIRNPEPTAPYDFEDAPF